ncbi:uncharacterized protein JN550_008346 [Neoarthrinium moseri]|uniref:uncharacterized protein n=1 Tax=Neoarthrinium moseri TaxID=1658444 RepID=UPI001FDB471D|nr:uncharacterized protein JN550_008346 [Neoarthrinium moseri]KAI1865298.1 hypothetical protein JN550_008346 [Neoarthrinium moseri]
MSNAKVLSTKLVTTITKDSRVVQIGFVDKTDIWNRTVLSAEVQQKFTKVAEGYIDTLRPDTNTVALQETPHKSESDNRTHFTAVELDGSGKVTAKRHFTVD